MTEIVSSTIQTPFQAPSTSTTSMSAALSSNEKTMSSPNIFNTSSLDVTLAYQSYLNSSGQEPTPFHLQSMLLPNMCLTLFEEEKYEFRPLPTMHATMDSMMFMFGCSENEIVPLDHNNLKNGDMILIASKSNITLKKMFLGFREDGTFFTDSLPSNKCIFLVKHKSNLGFALSIESGAYACVESRQFRLTTNYFYDECTFFLKPTSSNVLLKEVTKMMESHSSSTLVKQKSTALFPPLSATIEILPPQPTDTKSHLLTRMASSDSMAQPFMHAKSYSQLQPKPSMNLIMSPSSMVPNSKEPLSTYSKPSLVRFQGGPSIFQSPSATKEPLNFLSHVAILDSKKRFLVEPKFDHILKFQKLKIKKKYCPQILFFELLSLSAPCIPPPIDLCHLTALNLHQSTSYVLLKTPSNMYLNVNLDQTLKLVSTPNECSIFLFKSLPHSPIAFALQSYPFNAYLGRKNKTCKALGATLSLRESFTFHVPPLPQQALQVQNMRPPPKPPLAMSVAIVSGAVIGGSTGLTNFVMNLQKRAQIPDPPPGISSPNTPPPPPSSSSSTSSSSPTPPQPPPSSTLSSDSFPSAFEFNHEPQMFQEDGTGWTGEHNAFDMEANNFSMFTPNEGSEMTALMNSINDGGLMDSHTVMPWMNVSEDGGTMDPGLWDSIF